MCHALIDSYGWDSITLPILDLLPKYESSPACVTHTMALNQELLGVGEVTALSLTSVFIALSSPVSLKMLTLRIW